MISEYILLFFIYSIAGWIVEVVCKLVDKKKFINRGFLIGPYCPIYGTGALIMTILLDKYLNDPITLFIMAMLSAAILEYITSYLLEKIFATRWWDYSNYKFNINGRICLETMIPFGLFGMLIMYITNPFLFKYIELLPDLIVHILAIILLLIFITDFILSFKIIYNIKNMSKEVKKDSTEKVTKYVKDVIQKQNKLLQKRIINAFPNLKFKSYYKGKNIFKRKKKDDK